MLLLVLEQYCRLIDAHYRASLLQLLSYRGKLCNESCFSVISFEFQTGCAGHPHEIAKANAGDTVFKQNVNENL